jgi:hypothetical protein
MSRDIKLAAGLIAIGALLLCIAWVGWLNVLLTVLVTIGIKIGFTIIGVVAIAYGGYLYINEKGTWGF